MFKLVFDAKERAKKAAKTVISKSDVGEKADEKSKYQRLKVIAGTDSKYFR